MGGRAPPKTPTFYVAPKMLRISIIQHSLTHSYTYSLHDSPTHSLIHSHWMKQRMRRNEKEVGIIHNSLENQNVNIFFCLYKSTSTSQESISPAFFLQSILGFTFYQEGLKQVFTVLLSSSNGMTAVTQKKFERLKGVRKKVVKKNRNDEIYIYI